ncbi:sialin-like isoform X2 [Ornithodoros turicata]|uniref:sialin-like isoform X2 n=1 Tax=Ornithodoros turicata TaxID=34597 RepID=UPI0031392080
MSVGTEEPSDTLLSGKRRSWKDVVDGIQTRHVLALLGFLGFVNVYALRVNLSVALVAMVNHTAIKSNSSARLEEACTVNIKNITQEKLQDGPLEWDEYRQGIALGAFFYGYVLTQVPGGRLAERVGAKWLFGGGILVTALLTLLTPVAALSSFGAFVVLRVIMGLGEGVTFPAMHAMIARWLPKDERSLLSTIIYSGGLCGTVVAMPLSGILCASNFLGGWPAAFYVFGVIGILWFVLWALLVHNSPQEHPRISQEERIYIETNQGDEHKRETLAIPWRAVLTSLPFWALMLAHFGQNWGAYTLLTELPSYLKNIQHLPITMNGFLSATPYLLQAVVSWLAGYLADRVRRSGRFSVSVIRKFCNSIAFFGAAICLFAVSFVGCNAKLSVVLFTIAMGINGFSFSGYMVTHVDMSPDFAGTLMGMTNAFANLAGILAPLAVGSLTNSNETIGQWSKVFYLSSGTFIVSGAIFILFGSAELQPWGLYAHVRGTQFSGTPGTLGGGDISGATYQATDDASPESPKSTDAFPTEAY